MSAVRVNPTVPTYTHTQTAPATTWTINHRLGRRPAITILDAGGQPTLTDFTYTDINTVTVSFTEATAGTAYLN